jgi:hypothetical protein
MNKQQLIAAMHDARAPIAAAAALDRETLLGPAPEMDGWTRKDVLAHVEWWNNHSVRVVEALLAGREPYDRTGPWDTDATNARILEENRDRSADDVLRGEADSFTRLVAAVDSVPEDDLFAAGRFAWLDGGSLADLVESDSTKHYPDHVAHLR